MEPVQIKCKAGDRIWVVGDRYTFAVTGAETDGAYAVVDAWVSPGGGPPPHRHSREDEAFFVLDGAVDITVNGETRTVRAGESASAPRGSIHNFRNNTDAPAHMLFIVSPAGFENYLAEVGVAATEAEGDTPPEQDMDKLMSCAARYGLEFILPPDLS
jgi:quercetin dioxygenase-like cupin family protein